MLLLYKAGWSCTRLELYQAGERGAHLARKVAQRRMDLECVGRCQSSTAHCMAQHRKGQLDGAVDSIHATLLQTRPFH